MKFLALSASILAMIIFHTQDVRGGTLEHFVKHNTSVTSAGIKLSCTKTGPALENQNVPDCTTKQGQKNLGKASCTQDGTSSDQFPGTLTCPADGVLSSAANLCGGKEVYCKDDGGTTGDEQFYLSCSSGGTILTPQKQPTCTQGKLKCEGEKNFLDGNLKCDGTNGKLEFKDCSNKKVFCASQPNFEVSCQSNGQALPAPFVTCDGSAQAGKEATCKDGDDENEFKGTIKCTSGSAKILNRGEDACPGGTPLCRQKKGTEHFKLVCDNNKENALSLIPKCLDVPQGSTSKPKCHDKEVECAGRSEVKFVDSEGKEKSDPCGSGKVICQAT